MQIAELLINNIGILVTILVFKTLIIKTRVHNYSILEKRLIDFSTNIISLINEKSNSFVLQHLGKQLIRSSTSACLNYGEAQCAESQKDFIHKMRLCLKELKESSLALQIIAKLELRSNEQLTNILDENKQLIAIFYKSIQTATKNNNSIRK